MKTTAVQNALAAAESGYPCEQRGDAWEGPAPTPALIYSTDWPPIVPLPTVPDVPAFPLDVLPAALADLAREISDAMNAPPDFAATIMLALAGGAIGNARYLSINSSYSESPCLYAAIVGRPGSAKTPPLKLLRRPFDERQRWHLEDWKTEVEKWEALDENSRGNRPVPKRIIVADTTTESLAMTLGDNPRGVVMVRDELMEHMASMNQYKGGKGQDRQIYLRLWANDTIIVDRKADRQLRGGPLYASRPFVGIIGGIQPGALDGFRASRIADGHLDRWLWCFPDDRPAAGENWREVSDLGCRRWTDAADRLLTLEMIDEGAGPRPKYVHLTDDAKPVWQAITDGLAARANALDADNPLRGPLAKLKAYAVRLALIVQNLRWACGETAGENVDAVSMGAAATLVEYFREHARKVYVALDADRELAQANRLIRWIRGEDRKQFTQRDAHRALRPETRFPDDVEPVLTLLERHGMICPAKVDDRHRPGRKPSPTFDVHPEL